MTVETPHFAYPFRFETKPGGGLAAAVTEQHSADEIADCVTRIAHTPRGSRDESPTFGISDPTFEQAPVNSALLVDELREWEPRADFKGTARVDTLDELTSIIRLDVDPANRGEA